MLRLVVNGIEWLNVECIVYVIMVVICWLRGKEKVFLFDIMDVGVVGEGQ